MVFSMKSTLLLFVFVLGTILTTQAQVKIGECGTEPLTQEEAQNQPWFGNNQSTKNNL